MSVGNPAGYFFPERDLARRAGLAILTRPMSGFRFFARV